MEGTLPDTKTIQNKIVSSSEFNTKEQTHGGDPAGDENVSKSIGLFEDTSLKLLLRHNVITHIIKDAPDIQ